MFCNFLILQQLKQFKQLKLFNIASYFRKHCYYKETILLTIVNDIPLHNISNNVYLII